jgi:ribonuclease HI
MYNLASINVFTDGGSRGNPGPAALGVFIENDKGEELKSIGKTLGIATNNVAEYSAIKESLIWILENLKEMPDLQKINFYMDSNLAVQQLNGIFKIKNTGLMTIYFEIKSLENQIKIPITYTHIPREQNKKADRMVNLALDGKLQA